MCCVVAYGLSTSLHIYSWQLEAGQDTPVISVPSRVTSAALDRSQRENDLLDSHLVIMIMYTYSRGVETGLYFRRSSDVGYVYFLVQSKVRDLG